MASFSYLLILRLETGDQSVDGEKPKRDIPGHRTHKDRAAQAVEKRRTQRKHHIEQKEFHSFTGKTDKGDPLKAGQVCYVVFVI